MMHVRKFTTLVSIATCLVSAASTTVAGEIPWRSPVARPANAPQAGSDERSQSASALCANAIRTLARRPEAKHIVVQFDRPVTSTERQRLEDTGVHLLSYLSENAYFAWLSTNLDADAAVASAPFKSTAAIETSAKLHPELQIGRTPDWPVVAPGDDPTIGAYVMLHPDADPGAGAALVAARSGLVRDFVFSVNTIVVEAPVSALRMLAADDAVQWIEPALPRLSTCNAENRAITGADIVQAAPYSLTGAGVTVLIYDAGTARATHVDFGGRLTSLDGSGLQTHSTHVAATVGGNGAASGGVNRGMAPGVTLLSYGFEYDGSGTFLYTNPGDIEDDYTAAIGLGADISNDSIGTNTETNFFPCSIQGDYGVTDALIDSMVRGSVSGGAPFRIVWSAGNERQGNRCDVEGFGQYYSTAPPAVAKNHLCIGALNANDDSMTSFSSWGPTDDGRMKPDFCGPGCQVGGDNGVTSASAANDTAYAVLCGTSMSGPTVCGLASLLLQDYRAHFAGPDPRNSTLKVLFAQNAVDRGNVGPDYQFGYGSVRIQPTIDFMRTGNFLEQSISQGEALTYHVNIAPGTTQLKITIAWDDPPATPNVIPSLVNDLDLRVTDPTAVQRFPWTLNPLNPSAPAVRTQVDRLNNIEQVLVDNPPAGQWTVAVVGHSVPIGPQVFSIASSAELHPFGLRVRLTGEPPTLLPAGTAVTLPVEIVALEETVVPGSETLFFRYAGGAFEAVPLTTLGGTAYQAILPPAVCGATPEFYLSAVGTVSGQVTNPSGAPGSVYSAGVGTDVTPFDDAAETDPGWTVGATGDTATTGIWTRVDPNGTSAQPENDHTPTGTMCWVTGQGSVGGGVGENDVDGGRTTLTSPTIDASSVTDPTLEYWRWVSTTDAADVFTAQISNNNGSTWSTLEVLGITSPGWNHAEFRIADILPPTNQIKVRFMAQDVGSGSIVEAAIDDLLIHSRECQENLADCNSNGVVDADDISSGRSADANGNGVPDECDPTGCPGDVNGDGTVDLADLAALLSAFGAATGDPEFNAAADFDANGSIDLSDLATLLSAFGQDCP
jgi:hypothetical protein